MLVLSTSRATVQLQRPFFLLHSHYYQHITTRHTMATPSTPKASEERKQELKESLADVKSRVRSTAASAGTTSPTLVAVSKYKPSSDILACFEDGQVDFGENYVQELVDKANELPREIRWHFIGTLQSNKAKILAAIPNLYAIQTLTSIKAATALDKALPSDRLSLLNVLIQVNTSGEDSKSGLDPLRNSEGLKDSELAQLANHIVSNCPRLRLQGLMTIGALEQSLAASERSENPDFATLKTTRTFLEEYLSQSFGADKIKWGSEGSGRLELSMGMSSDFEAALSAGSTIVRVGTGIFGQRAAKSA
ncbi:hypothetical protein BDN72DRAFT_437240 [Pluteus cervinus]|uniref:Uncharacterized protein n=1 Tax=Pluteus cervinus TaxID=181527 RepID=A0ACD3B1R4_9AGAR|nr:hypothetical protein BDN72DRAFT_437240 [Pluteus cervinus]